MTSRARSIALSLSLTGAAAGLLAGIGAFAAACGDNGGPTGPAGGPVNGAADTHCVDPTTGQLTTQVTNGSDCQFMPPPDAPSAPDAPGTGSGVDAAEFGVTMYDQSGNDDDCKYHLQWAATPIYENTDVYFNVVATTLTDNLPATGANIFAEVFLGNTHSAPPTNQKAVESPPGTYKVGPIQFDEAGQWTVRFHLHEDCLDYADDSPHGHAAFYVQVP